MLGQMTQVAAGEGLAYDFRRAPAQQHAQGARAADLAKARGVQPAMRSGCCCTPTSSRAVTSAASTSWPTWPPRSGSTATRSSVSSSRGRTPTRCRPTSTRRCATASAACRSTWSTASTASPARSRPRRSPARSGRRRASSDRPVRDPRRRRRPGLRRRRLRGARGSGRRRRDDPRGPRRAPVGADRRVAAIQKRHGASAALETPTRGPAAMRTAPRPAPQVHGLGVEQVGALVLERDAERLGQVAGAAGPDRPRAPSARAARGPARAPRGRVRRARARRTPPPPGSSRRSRSGAAVRAVDVQPPRRAVHDVERGVRCERVGRGDRADRRRPRPR